LDDLLSHVLFSPLGLALGFGSGLDIPFVSTNPVLCYQIFYVWVNFEDTSLVTGLIPKIASHTLDDAERKRATPRYKVDLGA
jgi:hypothetical protein